MKAYEKLIYHFTLLRHGESIGNAQSRWQGQSDYPLTERGRAQARALAERWQAENVKFDLVIASPLVRARETAEIISQALNAQLEIDPIWMERDIGEMEGLTAEEVRQRPQPPFERGRRRGGGHYFAVSNWRVTWNSASTFRRRSSNRVR